MPELRGEDVECLKCGHHGVDLEGPDEGDTDTFDFECPACGHTVSMEGPLMLPADGGLILDFGGGHD